MNLPSDPWRNPPLTFDQWYESFKLPEVEDQQKMAKAAANLLKSPVFSYVVSRMETRAVWGLRELRACPGVESEELLAVLKGLSAIRQELHAMAEDAIFDAK